MAINLQSFLLEELGVAAIGGQTESDWELDIWDLGDLSVGAIDRPVLDAILNKSISTMVRSQSTERVFLRLLTPSFLTM